MSSGTHTVYGQSESLLRVQADMSYSTVLFSLSITLPEFLEAAVGRSERYA